MANSVNPGQTAPIVAVCSGSTLFASILNLSVIIQGAHPSGKSQGNLIFLQGQGKVGEFCKMVREIRKFLNGSFTIKFPKV